jgi:hypothetical protein
MSGRRVRTGFRGSSGSRLPSGTVLWTSRAARPSARSRPAGGTYLRAVPGGSLALLWSRGKSGDRIFTLKFASICVSRPVASHPGDQVVVQSSGLLGLSPFERLCWLAQSVRTGFSSAKTREITCPDHLPDPSSVSRPVAVAVDRNCPTASVIRPCQPCPDRILEGGCWTSDLEFSLAMCPDPICASRPAGRSPLATQGQPISRSTAFGN